jgi:hypothetical protein
MKEGHWNRQKGVHGALFNRNWQEVMPILNQSWLLRLWAAKRLIHYI